MDKPQVADRYLTAVQVRAFFGGISQMTLWRWLNDNSLAFPRPIVINGRRLFDEAAVRAWAVARRVV